MANAKYSAYNTGALFDPDAGAGSVLAGTSNIPRSIASDGRRWVLFFHVMIHILAIAANVVNTVLMNRDFSQSQIKVASIVATAMHGAGVLALLALAAAELKQVSFVVSMGMIYSFLVSALIATAVTATFTFRSDDLLTDSKHLITISRRHALLIFHFC
jgi:hypothetical protein